MVIITSEEGYNCPANHGTTSETGTTSTSPYTKVTTTSVVLSLQALRIKHILGY